MDVHLPHKGQALTEPECRKFARLGHDLRINKSVGTSFFIGYCGCGVAFRSDSSQGVKVALRAHLMALDLLPPLPGPTPKKLPPRPHNTNTIRRNARRKLPQIILSRGEKCYWCKRIVLPTQRSVEHIIPLFQGGSNNLANLAIAHIVCNTSRVHPERPVYSKPTPTVSVEEITKEEAIFWMKSPVYREKHGLLEPALA